MRPPLLEARNLSVRYVLPTPLFDMLRGRKRVVDAVIAASFSVREGETLAIVGESGSGKSSLGRALVGLEKIASGNVFMEGENPFLKEGGGKAFHRQAAMMFQDPVSSLSPRRNVGQLIAEPFAIHEPGRRDVDGEVRRLLGLVGLDSSLAERYPHQLSGGQARRVGVARAIALSPKLIIADEPTAGLDVSVQADVLNLLRSLQDRSGMAYVLITHNLSLIRHVANWIGVMYVGRLVEYGPAANVLAQPAHPYTAALIAAQPSPDPDARRVDAPLLGETPSLLNRPSGCEFRTRCPHAFSRCALESPARAMLGPEHMTLCHKYTLNADADETARPHRASAAMC